MRLPALLFLVLMLAGPAQAQPIPGLGALAGGGAGGDAAAEAPAEPSAEAASEAAQALIDVLKNPEARAALLRRLRAPQQAEQGSAGEAAAGTEAASADAAGPAAGSAADAPAEPARAGVAEWLAAQGGDALTAAQDGAQDFLGGLDATARRLDALRDPERLAALLDALRSIGLTVLATLAVFFALRLPSRRAARRIGERVAEAGPLRRALGWLWAVATNTAVVLLAWAAGYAIAYTAIGAARGVSFYESLYLDAFLAVQLARVAIRAVLMPNAAPLRAPPFSDAGAMLWTRRLQLLASLLGYGLMLAAPLVTRVVSYFTGRAVEVVIYALAAAIAIAFVWRARKQPAAWLARRRALRGDATSGPLIWAANLWCWPALAWLAALFVAAVSDSTVAPLLASTAKVAGVLGLGAGLAALLGRAARSGLSLPEGVTGALPMLEERLNRFLASFLTVGRVLILLATLVAALSVTGVLGAEESAALIGEARLGAVASVAVIVLIAFAIWLAMASWIDYRLNPDRIPVASPREQTLLTLLRNAATVAIIIFALMLSFSELGLDLAPLIASAGVLGLAIGFGAQKLVQDIITGAFIQFERAISVGDNVTVAGTNGTVEKLTIRSVSLRDLDGVFHVIPFSSVDMVSNFTRDFSFHVADLGIAYREDVEEGKAVMVEAFETLRQEDDYRADIIGPFEWFGVQALGDNAVTLRGRIRARPGRQWAIGRRYNELLKAGCDARDIEIPFPQQTLWFGVAKDGSPTGARLLPERRAAEPPRADAPVIDESHVSGPTEHEGED